MKATLYIFIVFCCSASLAQAPGKHVEVFLRDGGTKASNNVSGPKYKNPPKRSTFYERAYNRHKSTYRSPYQTYGYIRGGTPRCVPRRGLTYTDIYLKEYW